jgi:AcrR family transcriptional regulator
MPRRRRARTPIAEAATPDPDPTQVRILAAARELFAQRGFAGAGTRDIAAAAGVNQGLIAYHFGGKDALFQAVVDGELERLCASLDRAGPDAALPDLLSACLDHQELVQLIAHALLEPGPRRAWLLGPACAPARDKLRARLARSLPEPAAAPPTDPVLLLTFAAAALALAAFGPALAAALDQPLDRAHALHVQAEALAIWSQAKRPRALGPWAPRRSA